ncbi:MAG: helix-turn-helix transcriptional regulator [Clostridia bacterium]|nr:helix-turn-helix transcriptional regulator [Clostridia bacterium]
MKHVNLILGKNIQALRRKNGWSQAALAMRLGVTPQAVSKWEQSKTAPDLSLLPKIALLFGCRIDDLFVSKDNF